MNLGKAQLHQFSQVHQLFFLGLQILNGVQRSPQISALLRAKLCAFLHALQGFDTIRDNHCKGIVALRSCFANDSCNQSRCLQLLLSCL